MQCGGQDPAWGGVVKAKACQTCWPDVLHSEPEMTPLSWTGMTCPTFWPVEKPSSAIS